MRRYLHKFSNKSISPLYTTPIIFGKKAQFTTYRDILPLSKGPKPWFNIKQLKFEITPEKKLKEFKEDFFKKYSDIKQIQVIEPFTFSEYSETTLLEQIIKNDFIFKINNEKTYKVISDLEAKSFKIFSMQKNHFSNEEKEIFALQKKLGTCNFFNKGIK